MRHAWQGTIRVGMRRTEVPATSNIHMKKAVSAAIGRHLYREWPKAFGRPNELLSMDLEFGLMILKAVMNLRPRGRNSKSIEYETGFCLDCKRGFSASEGHPDNGCPFGTVYAVLAS